MIIPQMVIMLVITWRTNSLRYLLRAGSYWNTWGAGLNWGRLAQTGTELHRLGGLPRAVSSVKQKGWFADVLIASSWTLCHWKDSGS